MAATELYSPQGAEMISGMIDESDAQGEVRRLATVWWLHALYKYILLSD